MSSWIRMGVVMASAVVVLACHGKTEPSASGAAGAEGASEATAAVETQAMAAAETEAAAAVETEAAVGSKAEEKSDAKPAGSELVNKARDLLQLKTIKSIENGIQVTFFLDYSPAVSPSSKPEQVTDAMMFACFYAAPLLYARLPNLNVLRQVFVHQQKDIGTITMKRASFEGLHYGDAMKGAGDPNAKQAVYRKLIKQLPQGAVAVDEKFAP